MLCHWLILHRGIHRCGFDEEQRHINVTMENLISSKSPKAGYSWNNIRIWFDYRYLTRELPDSMMCKNAGERITWKGQTFACSYDDVLTQPQINAIIGTFEAVKNYLQRLLKVIPLRKSFKLHDYLDDNNYPYLINQENNEIKNTDLYMAIVSRPRGRENVIASAGSNGKDTMFYRPYMGAVFLNPVYVPQEAQNENSNNNKYFMICLHEVLHALGLNANDFQDYHPYETNRFHPRIFCELKVKGKKMKFLVTPYAQKFATKHFGVSMFVGDEGSCEPGIEIEDGGGPGTAGTHWEIRTYMTELMTGVMMQPDGGRFSRLTDATVAALQDTGNYKVTYTMAQPLVWGNPESIDGWPIENFAIGPPMSTFPTDYLWKREPVNEHYTGFDYKYWGDKSYSSPPKCEPGKNEYYCNAKEFFNPLNLSYVGKDEIYDYMTYKNPTHVCPKGKAMLPTNFIEGDDWGQLCGEYECTEDFQKFTWRNYIANSQEYDLVNCTKENVGKIQNIPVRLKSGRTYNRNLICPDPERFCRTVKLQEAYFPSDPFDPDFHFFDKKDKPTPGPEPVITTTTTTEAEETTTTTTSEIETTTTEIEPVIETNTTTEYETTTTTVEYETNTTETANETTIITSEIEPIITTTETHEPIITTTETYEPIITTTETHEPIITTTETHEPIITTSQTNQTIDDEGEKDGGAKNFVKSKTMIIIISCVAAIVGISIIITLAVYIKKKRQPDYSSEFLVSLNGLVTAPIDI